MSCRVMRVTTALHLQLGTFPLILAPNTQAGLGPCCRVDFASDACLRGIAYRALANGAAGRRRMGVGGCAMTEDRPREGGIPCWGFRICANLGSRGSDVVWRGLGAEGGIKWL